MKLTNSGLSPSHENVDIERSEMLTPLLREWEELSSRSSPRDRWLELADSTVRLRFLDAELEHRLMGALEHLAVTEQDRLPDLTIYLGHSSSGGKLPDLQTWLPTWDEDDVPLPRLFGSPRVRMMVPPDQRALNALDLGSRTAVFWTADIAGLPYWEDAAPLRTIFHWWTGSRGLQQIHAGAVGNASGGVLLVGKGGSGKSTSTLACLCAGMLYGGDDYVVVEVGDRVIAHSIYGSGKLQPRQLRHFDQLQAAVRYVPQEPDEKAVVFPYLIFPERVVRRIPIRALVVPVVKGPGATTVSPISRGEAMRALAPSTVYQLPGSSGDALARMSLLVRTVPAFRLEMGGSIEDLPRAVSELLVDL